MWSDETKERNEAYRVIVGRRKAICCTVSWRTLCSRMDPLLGCFVLVLYEEIWQNSTWKVTSSTMAYIIWSFSHCFPFFRMFFKEEDVTGGVDQRFINAALTQDLHANLAELGNIELGMFHMKNHHSHTHHVNTFTLSQQHMNRAYRISRHHWTEETAF